MESPSTLPLGAAQLYLLAWCEMWAGQDRNCQTNRHNINFASVDVLLLICRLDDCSFLLIFSTTDSVSYYHQSCWRLTRPPPTIQRQGPHRWYSPNWCREYKESTLKNLLMFTFCAIVHGTNWPTRSCALNSWSIMFKLNLPLTRKSSSSAWRWSPND